MELDTEGGASFEQLQDLIKKECDKQDKKYRSLEQKHNKLQESLKHSQPQKNLPTRGQRGASNKKKSQQQTAEGCQTNTVDRLQDDAPDLPPAKTEKLTVPTTTQQATIWKVKTGQSLAIATEEKASRHRSEQVTTAIANKIKQQFGFIADPNKTLLHNASSAVPNTPTWCYVSRPSHLAFHDFTQQKQPAINLCSLLGLGLKFIPTPHCTNTWRNLKETSMPNFQHAIHLRFHYETYDPKMYVRSKWTPPHWTLPPVILKECLDKFFHTHWINYSKNELEK